VKAKFPNPIEKEVEWFLLPYIVNLKTGELVLTNRDYKKTLAQQEDLNWDGDPDLDAEYECEEEKDLDELVVKWFYD
jgi:hypothetical protein